PKNAASKRALKKREPVIEESVKQALFVKGSSTSEVVLDALKDLYALRRTTSVYFSKKNDLHPFDDSRPIEFLSTKNNTPLIVLASHSKKRPHCLTFMRTFDHQILDMFELFISRSLPMDAFEGNKPAIGNRATVVFNGDLWEVDDTFGKLKNSLLDLLGNASSSNKGLDKVNLKGIDHVISCTVDTDRVVHLRVYMILLKKSGSKLPKVELEECGPALEMTLGRTRFADDSIYAEAFKVPAELKTKKVKNIERDEMGDKLGRIHMHKQDFSKLQTRKMKGLKRGGSAEEDEEEEAAEETPRSQRERDGQNTKRIKK
ncbi:rRNA-binding ribosome biosynthesis protein rpf2, partial [Entophlyctis luteolus]